MQRNNYKKDFKKRPFKKRHTRADFYLEGCPEGVKVPDGELGTLERAMKYLKRQLKDSEKMFLYKNRRYYEKPSHKKKVKMERARAMQKREHAIQERMYGKNQCWFVLTDKGAK
jgi:ribosomal protein S21